MSKLMVIAVNVDDGTINEPGSYKPPRVVEILDSDFDKFVADIKAKGPRKANSPHEPYDNGSPNNVTQVLYTHSSPGCVWVIINGWPFCIG